MSLIIQATFSWDIEKYNIKIWQIIGIYKKLKTEIERVIYGLGDVMRKDTYILQDQGYTKLFL